MSPLAVVAFRELGLVFPGWRSDEGKRGALRTLALRYERGELSARELTSWAYDNIDYDAPDDLSAFVSLDNDLDRLESGIAFHHTVMSDLDDAVAELLGRDVPPRRPAPARAARRLFRRRT